MVNKNADPEVFSIHTDPKNGKATLVPNPTGKSITYTTDELKQWIENGLIPKELGEYELEHIEKILETMAASKQLETSRASQEELIELYKKRSSFVRRNGKISKTT